MLSRYEVEIFNVQVMKKVILQFLDYFPYFEKKKYAHVVTMLSVCLCNPLPTINFWMAEQVFMKIAMYVMAPESISTA
jgi:hypothetical protein